MSMKPIFYARGPDIRKGHVTSAFNLVDIYPMVCNLLNARAAPNNGSLDNTRDFATVATVAASSFFSSSILLSVIISVVHVCVI